MPLVSSAGVMPERKAALAKADAVTDVDDKAFAPPVPAARAMPTLPAAKAFDQFYYLGINWVNAWALDTPDGIILFDTLTNQAEAAQYIEGGLKALGLDPARIKYIVISHGHPDHFGVPCPRSSCHPLATP